MVIMDSKRQDLRKNGFKSINAVCVDYSMVSEVESYSEHYYWHSNCCVQSH